MNDMNNYERDFTESNALELNEKDISEMARRFSGIKQGRDPKAVATYCAYDNDSPEDDFDRNTLGSLDNVRIELSLDQLNGFYTLDFIFDDPQNLTLKLFWAKLQKHKMNETYNPEKLWIFFIKLIENIDGDELEKRDSVLSVNILNPLAFYLVRTVPDSAVVDYEVEPGVFCGGNTVRMLLHKDLVTFQYDTIDFVDEENDSQNLDEDIVETDEGE